MAILGRSLGAPAVILAAALCAIAQEPCSNAGYVDGILADSIPVESVEASVAAVERGELVLPAVNGMPLCFGDAIVTGKSGTVRLRFPTGEMDAHECTVWPATRVELTEPASLFLRIGRLFLALRDRFDIVTRFVRLGARGTELQVAVSDSGIDVIQVEGSVEVVQEAGRLDSRTAPRPVRLDGFLSGPALFAPQPQRRASLRLERLNRLTLRRREEPRLTQTDAALFRRVVDEDSRVFVATRPDLASVNTIRKFSSPRERAEVFREARYAALWNPEEKDAFERLGDAYADWAEAGKALRSYEKSAGRQKSGRDLAQFCNNQGNAHRLAGHPDQAEAWYRRALQVDPRFAFPYNGLGETWRERAVEQFERGNLQPARQFLEQARENYRRSLDPSLWGKEGGPNRVVPLYNLGEAAMIEAEIVKFEAGPSQALRVLSRAEEHFRQAAREDSDYAFPEVGIGRIHAVRARLYSELKDGGKAAAEIEAGQAHTRRVLERWPAFAPARVLSGEILELRGDVQRASAEYLRATRADPGYAGAYFRTAAVMERTGQSRLAAGYYQTYLRVEKPNLRDTRRARDARVRLELLTGKVR
jgi:tetratricopeptide (TPR) repeat protein